MNLVFACTLVVALGLVSQVLPMAYQTNDEPTIALILQGAQALTIPPDPHSLDIHVYLGRLVSSLSLSFPRVPWYGLLIVSLYVLAYTVISCSLPWMNRCTSVGRRVASVLIFVVAYALLPLLLLQHTIVAGLLALAGLLPCVRYLCLRESSSPAMWGAAAISLQVGLMIRFEMAGLVSAACLPVLGLALLDDRDWRRAGLCALYLFGMSALGLGLYQLDRYTYSTSPAYARLLEFNQVRVEHTDRPSREPQQRPHAGIQWSSNDYAMFRGFMGVDSGAFTLETLRLLRDSEKGPGSVAKKNAGPADAATRDGHARGLISTNQKLEGMLRGRNARHIRLTLYLMVVFAAAGALLVGAALLGERAAVRFLGATACAVVVSCVLTITLFDRAVFRVLLPCAYVFLVMGAVFFPWTRLRACCDRASWRESLLLAVMVVFCFIGGAGVLLGGAQIRQNREERMFFEAMMEDIRLKAGTQRAVVAWPAALPLEYQSPFEWGDTSAWEVYLIGWSTSHPKWLNALKQRFGEDVYEGLTRSDVVHIVNSYRQLELLKRYSAEHYGKSVKGVRLGRWRHGGGESAAWVLKPQ